jgi:antitoxin (DNA-binding transcriptional repressor) of toxin-antitoxin stability system
MASLMPLIEVQARLPEILEHMLPGQKVFVTGADGHIMATLTKEPPPRAAPRQPGSAIGTLIIASDDDEHLKDFAEYMQ